MSDALTGSGRGLSQSLKDYDAAWQQLLVELPELPEQAVPTTISIKVADKQELFTNLQELADVTEQIHVGTVNDRFIASVALQQPMHEMYIIKLLERRPGSSDPLGLDSVDYLVDDIEKIHVQFQAKGIHIEKQHNDMHEWLSLRFGENGRFEAKFTDHLVLHIGIKELKHKETELLEKLDLSRK